MGSPTESQNQRILSYLQEGYSITPLSALKKFGCLRLGGRIWELRQLHHDIITDIFEDKKSKKRYASYRLAGVQQKTERALPGKGIVDFSKAIHQVGISSKIQQSLF